MNHKVFEVKKRFQAAKYFLFDFIGSAAAWWLFHLYRKRIIEPKVFGVDVEFVLDKRFFLALLIIPLFWVLLYYVNGFYRDVFRRSRLKELGNSLVITMFGVVVIFFLLILDDYIATYKNYYQLTITLFCLQFFITYIPRLIITSRTIKAIRKGLLAFPTIIVGDGEKALELFDEMTHQVKLQGNKIVGYVSTGSRSKHALEGAVPHLGDIKNLRGIVMCNGIEEVVIALETTESRSVTKVINSLLGLNISVKAIPSLYDFLTGRVKMSSIFGVPLIQVTFDLMPAWQEKVKAIIDRVASFFALLILFPLMVALAFIIKCSSKGPVFFRQERIGKYGKPFILYKFRTMRPDAEASGPALSSKDDNRVTPIGRFMRKTRLDELPNFYNVLRGDMSLVGPRPERQFYIDQIVKKAPHYLHLQKVKPGITSWGQVKYGYAENVDQMIERLKYDLLYLENMSLLVDFRIILYTLITVVRGRGV